MSAVFGLKRMLDQKWNPPKPATSSFAGKTILLTGANSGLGLEAAKKLVGLNAETLILTARTEAKGQAAKQQIEDWFKTQPRDDSAKATKIIPMVLSMTSFAAVQEFVGMLKAQFPGGIDAAILNAGMMNAKYIQSNDGWEETLQINTLSTFLLGNLLLPSLITAADSDRNPDYKPHLTFISSGTVWMIKPESMQVFTASETPLEDLSQPKNYPPGLAGGGHQYARSKLTLEYAVRHLAASPALKGADGKPKVIINTTCPGMCISDLGRDMAKGSLLVKLVQWLIFAIVARTAEDGANTYLTSLERGEETHGEMWKNDRVFEVGPMLTTAEGKQCGEKVWNEVKQVMLKSDESTRAFLA